MDISGWRLHDAVEYQFQSGTVIGPGQYLVVANDAQQLAAKYPGIAIVGDFDQELSNHDDWIRLIDADENPADEVHYYESGRWAEYADGAGSSLELRNPHADNTKAEAWAASDESGKSPWQTYTFRELSLRDTTNTRALFNELIFGIVEAGEVLIDDIEVIEDPDGTAVKLIQNGTFQGDTLGNSPAKWRIIGTHSGTVVADPADPANKVLHVIANGPQQHIHDHAETTFIGNRPIKDGTQYEFTFRAKWLGGNSQLNTRLFFGRAGHMTLLALPPTSGTPGAQNSTFQANIGPTYSDFGHWPIVPAVDQQATVSAGWTTRTESAR